MSSTWSPPRTRRRRDPRRGAARGARPRPRARRPPRHRPDGGSPDASGSTSGVSTATCSTRSPRWRACDGASMSRATRSSPRSARRCSCTLAASACPSRPCWPPPCAGPRDDRCAAPARRVVDRWRRPPAGWGASRPTWPTCAASCGRASSSRCRWAASRCTPSTSPPCPSRRSRWRSGWASPSSRSSSPASSRVDDGWCASVHPIVTRRRATTGDPAELAEATRARLQHLLTRTRTAPGAADRG